jgi:fructoselysine-6-P-deglycase FrlB-like protein
LGVVIFASGGPAHGSALALASDLHKYGAQVLVVQNGSSRIQVGSPGESSLGVGPGIDEFLAPILDVLPVQAYVQARAQALGIPPGFSYLQKVVKSV